MAKSPKPETEGPSFEESLEQLQSIVDELESGRVGLNDALDRYERGVKLLRRCHDFLQKAERRIELVSGVDAEGNPVVAPFHDEAGTLEEKAAQRSRRRTSSASADDDE